MEFDDKKIKHFDMIQSVINRMANNSFLIKGWAITLISALFALSAAETKLNLIFISYFILPVFWILDGYYLHQERAYRDLFDEVRNKTTDIDFNMSAKAYASGKNSWFNSTISPTLLVFYIGVMLVILIVTRGMK